jgi:hypothetical protein
MKAPEPIEIDEFFPSHCARVIDAIATIYQHEAHCKEQQLTAAQRLSPTTKSTAAR